MQNSVPLSLHQTGLLSGTETCGRSEHWRFARVCGGAGYLLHEGQPKSLAQDDVILIPAGALVRLRASQLSGLALCYFDLCPAELPGLFPVAEERALARVASETGATVQVLPRDSALGRQFAALCELREREGGLVLRSEMLRLAAHALRDAIRTAQPLVATSLEDRFRQVMSGTSVTKLMLQPSSELARRCGCSDRHFRRLFKQRFRVSLRAWQIQLRIRKAARLLRESDAKVVDVALECGFQHLGQFNTTFKQFFGKTPSLWRQSCRRGRGAIHCLRSACTTGQAAPAWWRELRSAPSPTATA